MAMFLNRSVLTVRIKQPFADWANSFDDGGPVLELVKCRRTPHAYLVVDRAESEDLDTIVNDYWREIFEHELDAWMREPDRWPAKRTRAMFHQWFDVELAPVAIDLCDEPLEDDVG